ncbi:hypothetical protein [Massilia timonae]|uniref:hypothetical protein n=1 Tax=Massilia timonae TaxID=47229 RepID=UPI0008F567E3|nr:hypothetical protein [Massilia timonae]
MELTLTDGIAGLALLVAILSAVSSGKSADSAESSAASARKANELAQHNERLAIYKSLQKFSFELHARGTELPDTALWEFYDAANISEFYYPQVVAKQLVDIADAANKYLAMRDLWRGYREGGASQTESARNALKSLHERGPALRKQCKEADEALRAYLRLEAKPEE